MLLCVTVGEKGEECHTLSREGGGGGVSCGGARGLIVSYHSGCLVNRTVNPAGVSVEQHGNGLSQELLNGNQLEWDGGRLLIGLFI